MQWLYADLLNIRPKVTLDMLIGAKLATLYVMLLYKRLFCKHFLCSVSVL